MISISNIYPKLMMDPSSGSQTSYAFPLFVPEDELLARKIPMIQFMCGGKFVQDPADIGLSGNELVRAAFNGLREKHCTWIRKIAPKSNILAFLYIHSDKDGSVAEKILDPSFMLQAADILQCDRLIVAIPNSSILMVRGAASLPEATLLFHEKMRTESQHLSSGILSDLIFIYENGSIRSVEESNPTAADLAGSTFSYPVLKEGQYLNVIEMPVFTGDFLYKVEIAAANDNQLLDLCGAAIFYLLRKNLYQQRFLGIIEFLILKEYQSYSIMLDDKLTQFWVVLQQSKLLTDMCYRLRKDIELSIIFGEHFSQGEGYKKKYLRSTYTK